MRHWILSKMIHCPCENELVYLLEKTVMLEEKCLLGKHNYKSTVMDEAGTMKGTGSWIPEPAVFAHKNYLKLPGYACPVPRPWQNTSSPICKSWFNHEHLLTHTKAESSQSCVVQIYDMDVALCTFVLRAQQKNKFCSLFCSASLKWPPLKHRLWHFYFF